MQRFRGHILGLLACLGLAWAQSPSIVDFHGDLRVSGNRIVNERDEPVQLRGMSLYWSQWQGDFYNRDAVRWLVNDWKCTVIRAAMAVEEGGYLENPDEEKNKVITVIDAAIEAGVYVIVDWHDHDAHQHASQSREFFGEIAQRYADVPNLIYEPYNEPVLNNDGNAWSSTIKPYHESVIQVIRQHTDNLIICGTRTWSQDVDEAADNPINNWDNIAYTLHFYAGTHGQFLRDKAQDALDRGVALMVTEWGTSEASGDGNFARSETEEWWNFLDSRSISWANWSVAAINETSASLNPGAGSRGNWSSGDLSPSGQFVRAELIDKYEEPVIHVNEREGVEQPAPAPARLAALDDQLHPAGHGADGQAQPPARGKAVGAPSPRLWLLAGSKKIPVDLDGPVPQQIALFTLDGKKIRVLNGREGRFYWDGLKTNGEQMSPGIYALQGTGKQFYRFPFTP